MAFIRYEIAPEFKDRDSIFNSISRADEILRELHQILYNLERSGVKLVVKESPSDSEPNGEEK